MTRTCLDCQALLPESRALRCDPCRKAHRTAGSTARNAAYRARRTAEDHEADKAWMRHRYRELHPAKPCERCFQPLPNALSTFCDNCCDKDTLRWRLYHRERYAARKRDRERRT